MSAPTVETIIISKLEALDKSSENRFDKLNEKVDSKVDALKDQIQKMMNEGCSKASLHGTFQHQQEEIFSRLSIIEKAQAEGKGRLAIVMILAGAILSLFMQWVGKRL